MLRMSFGKGEKDGEPSSLPI